MSPLVTEALAPTRPHQVVAAEALLAGINPANSWRLPSKTNSDVWQFWDPTAIDFEYRFLADIPDEVFQEIGLEADTAEDDDDAAFLAQPVLRRVAILAALEELLLILSEAMTDHENVPKNPYLFHGVRMAWRRALTELLGLWYREEREEHDPYSRRSSVCDSRHCGEGAEE